MGPCFVPRVDEGDFARNCDGSVSESGGGEGEEAVPVGNELARVPRKEEITIRALP